MALLASIYLARRVVRPLQTLRLGVERIGSGDLDFRLQVKTGDEIELLADEFNKMTSQLQESYSNLEQKVEDRTTELSNALEQQTATSEVLSVIARSRVDLQPVYQTILANTTRLCEANIAALFLYDGEVLSTAASYGTTQEYAEHLENSELRPSGETTTRLAALERRTVHVADLLSDPAFSPKPRQLYEKEDVRTVLSVPLLREDKLIGVITTWRREVRPFTDKQVALVNTFADQAVIAIENVRLFNELDNRNRQLTEALEHQTATAEMLGIISRSPTDVQPVLDAIVESAARVCGIDDVTLRLREGNLMAARAHTGPDRYSPDAKRSVSMNYKFAGCPSMVRSTSPILVHGRMIFQLCVRTRSAPFYSFPFVNEGNLSER